MKKYLFLALIFFFPVLVSAKNLPLNQLKLPAGIHIEIYADNVSDARELALGDKGLVFVGSRENKVYALVPNAKNTNHPIVKIIASNLNQPQGVAFYHGNLYVAEVDRIISFDNIEQHLDQPPTPRLITQQLPSTKDTFGYLPHSWKTIHFGPDNKLYVAIGSPCNSCLSKDPRYGTIMRMEPDGSHMEIFAKGIRNSVGFAWQPGTNKLWFTDNGRDNMGDNIPPDKLNYAPLKGLDFGYPYYQGKDQNGNPISDPTYGKFRTIQGITWETLSLPAHVASLGMIFYTGHSFPAEYYNQIIVAEHGSWNRSKKIGYRLSLIKIKNDKALSYTPFIYGWEKDEKYWGRPVALLVMQDGSVLVSDDYAGIVYRISYHKENSSNAI
jgi:glucose/arabinose dehydrogenase